MRSWRTAVSVLLSSWVWVVAPRVSADAPSDVASVPGAPAVPQPGVPPLPRERVPAPLVPWIDWVLHPDLTHGCPLVDGSALCVFPGALSLSVNDTGATFAQTVVLDRDGRLELPSGASAWPTDVRSDGVAVPVLAIEDTPVVELPAGTHRIEGRFTWRRMPEVLHVSNQTAIVELSLGNERVALPHREDDGTVWLGRRGAEDQEPERLEVEVYRRLDDGVPLAVTTRIVLRAGGRAREIDLGVVGLSGSTPIALESDVPARLDASGKLAVQVRPGLHTVTLTSRLDARTESIAAPTLGEPWPAEETWVFAPDPSLRQAQVDGAPSIDPSRTAMPTEWHSLPAFVLARGAALAIHTIRRGHPEPPPNAIDVTRELWLDLDGVGFTARDRLTGTMRTGFRLDLTEGALGHARESGEDLLITRGPGGSGIEVRRESVAVDAEWRLDRAMARLPAVAWSEDAHSLATTLHLPPGYELLATLGVDEAPGTWIARWDVWAFFFVLIVALATGKLLGWRAGIVALLALVLTYGEPGAPRQLFLVVLALLALVVAVPEGAWRKAFRIAHAISLLGLLLIALPYGVGELRTMIHPRLAESAPDAGGPARAEMDGFALEAPAPMAAGAPAAPPDEGSMGGRGDVAATRSANEQAVAGALLGSDERLARRAPSSNVVYGKTDFLRQDPNAVVQTGPGVPRWTHNQYALGWTGPVQKGHQIQLLVLTPFARSAVAGLRVLFLGWLLFLYAHALARSLPRRGAEAVAAAAFLLFVPMLPSDAHAQAPAEIPSPELLAELHDRLVAPPTCAPNCVSVGAMRLSVRDATLTVEMDVDAGALTAVRLPGPASQWMPSAITVDGVATSALAAAEGRFVLLRVPAGRHLVHLVGSIQGDQLVVALGSAPGHVTVTAPGWDVQGVREDGHADDTLRLVRLAEPNARQGNADLGPQNISPWLEIERTLEIGVRWVVRTHVRRVSPTGVPVVARLPLLPGESVADPAITVEGDRAVISLGRDQAELDFESALTPRASLTLTAPTNVPYAEVWRLRCGSVQRCGYEGVPPVTHVEDGLWSPVFRPFAGETLALRFARPEAAGGATTTIDRAVLHLEPGTRLLTATLTVEIRTSRGGVHAFTLPESSRVEALEVDGTAQPIELRGRTLRATLHPGAQTVTVRFQHEGGLATLFRTPNVGLGAEAANVFVEVTLPSDRLLLFTHGPGWGPVVLFWPYLLLVLLGAVLLARFARTPITAIEWALLGLGLTQIPVPAALVVVVFFVATAHRERTPELRGTLFNLRQIALVVLTLGALGCLYAAVHVGLLLRPDIQVAGAGSYDGFLRWYLDRTSGTTPVGTIVSVPLFAYRLVMLAWAMFLAFRLLAWLKWAFRAFGTGGYWKKGPPKPPVAPPSGGAGPQQGFGAPGFGAQGVGPQGFGPQGFGTPPTPPARVSADAAFVSDEPVVEVEPPPPPPPPPPAPRIAARSSSPATPTTKAPPAGLFSETPRSRDDDWDPP